MTHENILQHTNHRPWPLPAGQWCYYQEWNQVIFLHWQVDPVQLRKFIPEDLEIDLINGQAWISLVAFNMDFIRPRFVPSFPPISNFPEINLRSYVKINEKTGVYFMNIEAGKWLSSHLARLISALPYKFSKMRRKPSVFISENKNHNNSLKIEYSIGDIISHKSPFDLWLTERYSLFQDQKNQIICYDIHHLEWPLQQLEIADLYYRYSAFQHLFTESPQATHYSRGVAVLAWPRQIVKQ